MATILITGGTGLIGSALTKALVSKGHEVIILTRDFPKQSTAQVKYALWNLEHQTIDVKAVQSADFIIHLAGANVAKGRWTRKKKKEILESRTMTASLIIKALKENQNKVQAVISASAIGWYGADTRHPAHAAFTESDPPDDSFLGTTCKAWEESIHPVVDVGKRLVILRTGIVLSKEGGAYKEFAKPLQFGIATILGGGEQIISWVHINDIVGLYLYAIENNSMQGIYNAVAPHPVTNKKLILTMAKTNHIAIPIHVPAFLLKLILGEMSIEILKSAKVSNQKVEKAGYRFQFSTIENAVNDLK